MLPVLTTCDERVSAQRVPKSAPRREWSPPNQRMIIFFDRSKRAARARSGTRVLRNVAPKPGGAEQGPPGAVTFGSTRASPEERGSEAEFG